MCEKSLGDKLLDMFPADEIARNIDLEVIKSAKLAFAEEEYKKAQKEWQLKIINELNEHLDSMTDEELYDHMMKTSPSFRETMKKFNEFLESAESDTK